MFSISHWQTGSYHFILSLLLQVTLHTPTLPPLALTPNPPLPFFLDGNLVRDVKVRDVKVRDVKVRDVKVRDVKVRDVKVRDVKVRDVKVRDVKVRDVKVRE